MEPADPFPRRAGVQLFKAAGDGNVEAVRSLLEATLKFSTEAEAKSDIKGALNHAASEGHVEIVKILLEAVLTLKRKMKSFGPALCAAAMEGHTEVVIVLLEESRNFEKYTRYPYLDDALRFAASKNKIQVLEILREGRAGKNPFGSAICAGQLEAAKFLLDDEPWKTENLDGENRAALVKFQHRQRLLREVAWSGYPEMTKLLLEAEPYLLSDRGIQDAFEKAAAKGYIKAMKIVFDDMKVVNTLLEGGDIDSSGEANDGSALDVASKFRFTEVVKILSEAGTNFDVVREQLKAVPDDIYNEEFEVMNILHETGRIEFSKTYYLTALNIASRFGLTEVVKTLINKGVTVRFRTVLIAISAGHAEVSNILLRSNGTKCDPWQGNKALMWAIHTRQTEVVKELLKNNLNVSSTQEGRIPLVIACEGGQIEIVKMLLEENTVDLTCEDEFGTALTVACEGEHTEIVKLLLEQKDLDINALSANSPTRMWCGYERTALHIAREKGNEEITTLLLREVKMRKQEDRIRAMEARSPFRN